MSATSLLFLLIYAAGLLSAITVGPVWAFYLYELVYFLNPANRWWGQGIPQIGYSFYLVLVMLGMFVMKRKKQQNLLREAPEAKWFILMFLFYGIATLVAANPDMNSRFLGYLINTWVVIYIAYRMIDSEKKLELALVFFMIGAAYIGYEAFTVGRDEFGRVGSIGTVDVPGANSIAASIVPVIPLMMYFGWLGSTRIRVVATICAALIVNGLVLINSRGALLGGAAAFGYFITAMMFSKYKLPKQRIFIALIVLGSIAVIFRLVDETFIERMMTLQDQTEIHDTGSGSRRVHFWIATFDLLRDYPFGAGIYGFETLSPIYLTDPTFFSIEYGKSVRAVHSLWFQGLSEIGWLGFSAFLMLLYSLHRHLKKAKRILVKIGKYKQYYLLIAIEAGMLGFLISSTFINMFRAQVLYWMLLFGISASVVMIRAYGDAGTDEEVSESIKVPDKSADTPSP